MRFLTNADVSSLLDASTVVEALRVGYSEFGDGVAAQIPRADLIGPASAGTFRLGIMAGLSRSFDIAIVRIKSDVVDWRHGREEKHSVDEGLFSGTVVAFRLSDGAPLAIVQDGVLQHLRVGAAAALGTRMLMSGSVGSVGIIGSGGMARAISEALVAVDVLPDSVRVFSPNADHRRVFVAELQSLFPGAVVSAAMDPENAVRGAGLVVTATNSTMPTIRPEWLEPDVQVTAVSRREVGADLNSSADLVACLGPSSYPAGVVPGMTLTRGGYGAFVALSEGELSRVPPARSSDLPDEHPLMVAGVPWDDRPSPCRTVLTAVGTQGIQFAAAVGALLSAADSEDRGSEIPDQLFLHEVRN